MGGREVTAREGTGLNRGRKEGEGKGLKRERKGERG